MTCPYLWKSLNRKATAMLEWSLSFFSAIFHSSPPFLSNFLSPSRSLFLNVSYFLSFLLRYVLVHGYFGTLLREHHCLKKSLSFSPLFSLSLSTPPYDHFSHTHTAALTHIPQAPTLTLISNKNDYPNIQDLPLLCKPQKVRDREYDRLNPP